MINELVEKFNQYQRGEIDSLTMKEIQTLCSAEEHEVFMFDHCLYRDIMDYRDHLEMEG